MAIIIIRPATLSDASALRSCIVAAYAPFQELDLPPVADGIAADIADHNVWVADVDSTVQGGIVLVLGDHAHVANLAVHPDAGGQGIGEALMAQAMSSAAAAGHKQVKLATHAQMTGTQAFYRKRGWQETGRAGDKVYFSKELK